MDAQNNTGAGQGTACNTRVSKRSLIGIIGVMAWFAAMFVFGKHASQAILNAGFYIGFLLLATFLTRTVTIAQLAKVFLLGGFSLGVATLLCRGAHAIFPNSIASPVVVPLIETVLFLAPAAWLLWRNKPSPWLFGASDVMLLFACAGTGFSLMECAYIEFGSPSPFFLMPTAAISGDRIHGTVLANDQSIWGTLAGVSIGIGFLVRTRVSQWKTIAVSGIILCVLDHFALNSRFVGGSLLGGIVAGALMNGYLTMAVCFLGIIAVIALDLRARMSVPETIRLNAAALEKLGSPLWWTLERIARRMCYSYYRFMIADESQREQAAVQYLGFREFAVGYYRAKKSTSAATALDPITASPSVNDTHETTSTAAESSPPSS